jgi:hypothetical protein
MNADSHKVVQNRFDFETKEYLNAINDDALIVLINDILDLAK